MPLSSRKEVAVFVHKKLLFRLRRLALFFVIVASILIYEISQNYIAGILAFVVTSSSLMSHYDLG